MRFRVTLLGWAGLALMSSLRADYKPVIAPPLNAESDFAHPDNPPDASGALTIYNQPDSDKLTPFLRQAEYLRTHRDTVMLISYLQQSLFDPDISDLDRSRGMIELADAPSRGAPPGRCDGLAETLAATAPGPSGEAGAVAYRLGSLYTQMGLPSLARDTLLPGAGQHGELWPGAQRRRSR